MKTRPLTLQGSTPKLQPLQRNPTLGTAPRRRTKPQPHCSSSLNSRSAAVSVGALWLLALAPSLPLTCAQMTILRPLFQLPTLSWFVLAPGLASFSAPPPHAAACLLNLQGMSPAAVAPRLGSQVVLGLSEHQRSNPESRRAEVGSGIPQSSDTLVSLWSDRWYEELIVSACAFMWQEGASQAGPGMGILQDQAFLPPSSVTRQQQQQGVITRPATRPSATAAEREPSLSEESQGPTTSCISKRKAKAPEDSPGRGQRPSASESDAAEAAGARVWQRFHWKPLTGEGEGGMPLPSAPGTAEGSATSMSPSLILIRGDAVPSSGYPGPSDTWLATAVLPCANIEWSTLSNAAMKWLRNIGVCQLPSGHSSLFWCFQFIVPMHAFAVGSGMEEGTAAVCLQGPRCAAALHRLGIEEEPLVSAAAACEARLSSFIGILSAAEISASSPSSSPEAHLDHVSLMLKSAYTKRMWEADTSTPRQKAAAAAAAHASQPDIGSPADLKRPSRRGNALETPLPRGIESRGSVNSDIRSAMRALDVAAQTPLQVEELAAAADANGPQQAARHGHRVRTKGLHPDHLPRGLMIRYQQELEEALPRDQAVAGKVPHTPPGKPSNPRPKPQARGYQRPGRRLVNGTESGRPERGRQDRVPPNAKFQRPRPPSAEAPAPSTPLRAHSPIRASPRRHSGSSIPATPSAISAVVDGLITPATPRSNHSASKPLTFGSEARKPPLADRGSGALGVAAGRGRERRAVGHLDGEKEEGSGAGAGGGTGKYGAAKLSGEVGYSQDTLYLAMKTPTPRR